RLCSRPLLWLLLLLLLLHMIPPCPSLFVLTISLSLLSILLFSSRCLLILSRHWRIVVWIWRVIGKINGLVHERYYLAARRREGFLSLQFRYFFSFFWCLC